MFTVYAEKEAFENIILFADETPNWHKIFHYYSDICLNISEDELLLEENPGTVIFEFIHATGGKKPIPLKDFFETLYDENSAIAEKPRAAFFLNCSEEEAEALQTRFGVIVQSAQSPQDNILRRNYFKELPAQTIIENEDRYGWKTLFPFRLLPSNAMVITDNFLFGNEEEGNLVGQSNVVNLVDSLLPIALETEFHVAIISNDHPEVHKAPRSKELCERLAGNLKSSIVALRNYPIIVEVVFTKTIHKRKVFLNYMTITCDKGFAVFKAADGKTVRSDNDLRCEELFSRIDPEEGDTDFASSKSLLMELKQSCLRVKEYIRNSGQSVNYRIIGDCHPNKSVRNRLINDN